MFNLRVYFIFLRYLYFFGRYLDDFLGENLENSYKPT